MTHKEQLNEKVAHTEKILKWIKVLNDIDDHKQLENAIWLLKIFTRDIEYIYYGKNEDSDGWTWRLQELWKILMKLHNIPLCEKDKKEYY